MTVCFLAQDAQDVRVVYAQDGLKDEKSIAASSYAISNTPWTSWRARLTDLGPGRAYSYRIIWLSSTGSNASPAYHFHTLHPLSNSLKLAVFNDLHNNSQSLRALMRQIQPEDYDMTVLLGDCWNDPSKADGANLVFRTWAAYLELLDAPNKPVLFVRGNHETRGSFSKGMAALFETPGRSPHDSPGNTPWYFTLDLNPVFILGMDTGEDDDFETSEKSYKNPRFWQTYRRRQAEWLGQILSGNPAGDASWMVCLSHIPLAGHPGDFSIPSWIYWSPLLKNANVDLMLAGHVHQWRHLPKGYLFDWSTTTNGVRQQHQTELPWPILIGGGPALNNATVTLISADRNQLSARVISAMDGQVQTEFTKKHPTTH